MRQFILASTRNTPDVWLRSSRLFRSGQQTNLTPEAGREALTGVRRSRDPSFAAKLADVVGLYVDPPAHVAVLSLDEKSQIPALDRSQPGLRVAAGVGVSRPTVWRWQQRYAEVGVEGLLRDKTRKPGCNSSNLI